VTLAPPDSHRDLLERPLFAHLATVTADGAPLVNPMWFLWDDAEGAIKMTHTKKRHNYRYLQSQPRVAVAITDPDNQYRYLQLRGTVARIEDDPTGSLYAALYSRYRGKQIDEVKDRDVRVILTIFPDAYRTFG
jgi:PPOX class probable F420-dependent enzyme